MTEEIIKEVTATSSAEVTSLVTGPAIEWVRGRVEWYEKAGAPTSATLLRRMAKPESPLSPHPSKVVVYLERPWPEVSWITGPEGTKDMDNFMEKLNAAVGLDLEVSADKIQKTVEIISQKGATRGISLKALELRLGDDFLFQLVYPGALPAGEGAQSQIGEGELVVIDRDEKMDGFIVPEALRAAMKVGQHQLRANQLNLRFVTNKPISAKQENLGPRDYELADGKVIKNSFVAQVNIPVSAP